MHILKLQGLCSIRVEFLDSRSNEVLESENEKPAS